MAQAGGVPTAIDDFVKFKSVRNKVMAKKRTPKKKPQVLNNKAKPAAAKLKRPEFSESKIVKELYEHAKLAFKTKHDQIAVHSLKKALQLDPVHPESMALQAILMRRYAKTNKQKNYAVTLMQGACYQDNEQKGWLHLLARWHVEGNDMIAALSALQRVVLLDPNENAALMQIAGLYGSLGYDEESIYYTRQALKKNPVLTSLCKKERKLSLVVLMTATSDLLKLDQKSFSTRIQEGHNNLASLLDRSHITVRRVYVDNFMHDSSFIEEIKGADVVYNSITDADRCQDALKQANNVCHRLGKPVVNSPDAVLGTTRASNHQRFLGHNTVILPKSIKVDGVKGSCRKAIRELLAGKEFVLPVIVRIAGFQGGKHMHMVEDIDNHDFSELDALIQDTPKTLYVIQYHDVSYTDERVPDHRLYPKYRAFLVDGKLYPAHLFVTLDDFNVRRVKSNEVFAKYDWLNDEQNAYLDNPASCFPDGVWQTLEDSMRDVGLDYLGIDFANGREAADKGKLVVFEANASMRNMIFDKKPGDPVYESYASVNRAVHEMLCRVSGIEQWDFDFPHE